MTTITQHKPLPQGNGADGVEKKKGLGVTGPTKQTDGILMISFAGDSIGALLKLIEQYIKMSKEQTQIESTFAQAEGEAAGGQAAAMQKQGSDRASSTRMEAISGAIEGGAAAGLALGGAAVGFRGIGSTSDGLQNTADINLSMENAGNNAVTLGDGEEAPAGGGRGVLDPEGGIEMQEMPAARAQQDDYDDDTNSVVADGDEPDLAGVVGGLDGGADAAQAAGKQKGLTDAKKTYADRLVKDLTDGKIKTGKTGEHQRLADAVKSGKIGPDTPLDHYDGLSFKDVFEHLKVADGGDEQFSKMKPQIKHELDSAKNALTDKRQNMSILGNMLPETAALAKVGTAASTRQMAADHTEDASQDEADQAVQSSTKDSMQSVKSHQRDARQAINQEIDSLLRRMTEITRQQG